MTSRQHIQSLDGIRGLAALLVFVFHAGINQIPGNFGVTVFFFLSGYLITTQLRMEWEKTGDLDLSYFYLRRVYRIFPPMYLVLGLGILLAVAGISHGEMTWPVVLAQLAHFSNYAQALGYESNFVPYTTVMWSLAVEEHFYLVFPFALMLLLRRMTCNQIALTLAMTCAGVALWRCYLVATMGTAAEHLYVATDTRFDSILFGAILGLWRNPVKAADTNRWIGVLLLGTGSMLLILSFGIRNEVFKDVLRYTLQGIALLPLFYCAIQFHQWPIFRWLESPVMRFLGLISYTFYLSHLICLRITEHYFDNPVIVGLVAFAATTMFSTASYYLMERKLHALRRRLHAKSSHADPQRATVR